MGAFDHTVKVSFRDHLIESDALDAFFFTKWKAVTDQDEIVKYVYEGQAFLIEGFRSSGNSFLLRWSMLNDLHVLDVVAEILKIVQCYDCQIEIGKLIFKPPFDVEDAIAFLRDSQEEFQHENGGLTAKVFPHETIHALEKHGKITLRDLTDEEYNSIQ